MLIYHNHHHHHLFAQIFTE